MSPSSDPPPTVLVVDDEALLRLHACCLLEQAGYSIVEADNAEAAIAELERTPNVRLLFTDVQMPGKKDGMALAEEVHRRWPNVVLLVTSGEAKLTDADIPHPGRFVAKPYEEAHLLANVAELLDAGPKVRQPE